ncbi:MAG: hypothetical protein OEW15_05155 [Nitrospirota bacterium]|nr:hypothetical protein [Nitrospirota bacterium]
MNTQTQEDKNILAQSRNAAKKVAKKEGTESCCLSFAPWRLCAGWSLICFVFFCGIVVVPTVMAESPPGKGKAVVVNLFWGVGCPHCEKEKIFLQKLQKRYPGMVVKEYEVWKNKENAALYKRVLETAKIKQTGVPGTVIGASVYLGFSKQTAAAIEEAVIRCERDGCVDGVAEISSASLATGEKAAEPIKLPLLGTVDPAAVSLPLFTVVIAGLDSFNPCAFFVLLFLLSLLVHARSRGKMFLIGGIFVLFSGLIYFLFMAAWLTVFMIIGSITAITAAGGVVALIVGGINVKDFFLFRQGVSLSIPESAKPKLFERMRGLLRSQTLPALVAGTVVLAIAANAYELLCTAGFPMVYTRVLTLHKLTTFQYYQYLALYNVIYVLPLGLIVTVITITLGARKLSEWQGRQLKLLSGLMMTALGVVLIVDPALLNNVVASAALLAGVIVAAGGIIFITRKLKPEIQDHEPEPNRPLTKPRSHEVKKNPD